MNLNEEQSLRLMLQVSSDNSYGVSPIRVQNNLFDHDNGDLLRAPNQNSNDVVTPDRAGVRGANSNHGTVVSVVDLLT